MTKKNNTRSIMQSSFALIIGLLCLCFLLSLLLSVANKGLGSQGIPGWLLTSMYLYLIFIFLRTAFHLLFSFCWIYFKKKDSDQLKEFPLVSVIIPCFQEEAVIKSAIESALKLNYPNFEVLVVDDGSNDSTLAKAQEHTKTNRLRFIFKSNGGKASALNKGIEAARGEYVFCMDADSRLSPTVIQDGLIHFENNPTLAAVAGSVRIGNDINLITSFQKLEYITALNFLKLAQSFLQIVTVVPGPVGLFKKEKIVSVGGYSTTTFAEDCELTIRLLMNGHSVVYEPKMYATTEAPEDFTSLTKQRYRWSRGIVQAIKENSRWLLLPFKSLRNFFIVWYMVTESIFIPCCNYVFAFVSVYLALATENHQIIGYFFGQLVILDVLVVIYSLFVEHVSLKFIALGFFNRFTYGLALEIQRFFSIFDELLSLPMTWGKLQRKGMK